MASATATISTASIFTRLRSAMRGTWHYFRQITGDTAYENYLRCARRRALTPVSRSEFYLDSLNRRYSKPSRCC